jgi:hypothetical protein
LSDTPNPSAVFRAFREAQNRADATACLALVSDDAVFDVGRGRYAGKAEIERFLEMLFRLHTHGSDLAVHDEGDDRAVARWKNTDDDLLRLGIASIELEATCVVRDGQITALQARPSPESLAALRAAQRSGRDAEGLRLAESAGTLSED